jgi:hypothetical protein
MKKNTNVGSRISAKFFCAYLCFSVALIFLVSASSLAQNRTLIKRTTYKNEKIDFGAGGTVTIVGAPHGSIAVEGWQKNEIEISADIEVEAENEADLAQLAKLYETRRQKISQTPARQAFQNQLPGKGPDVLRSDDQWR